MLDKLQYWGCNGFVLSNRQNILLDSSLRPYVADFGFLIALPIQHGSSCVMSSVAARALAGTRGYLAPEFSAAKLSPKSDVFSYGVVCISSLVH